MASRFLQVLRGAARQFKHIDRFSKKVSFTYKGQDSFRTVFGGVVSFLLYCFVLGIAIYMLARMFDRKQVSVNQSYIYDNLYNSTEIYDIGAGGISFAFAITDYNAVSRKRTGLFNKNQRLTRVLDIGTC